MSHAATLAAQIETLHPERWKPENAGRTLAWQVEDSVGAAEALFELLLHHEVRVTFAGLSAEEENAEWDGIRETADRIIRVFESASEVLGSLLLEPRSKLTRERLDRLLQRAQRYREMCEGQPDRTPSTPLDPQLEADVRAVFGS